MTAMAIELHHWVDSLTKEISGSEAGVATFTESGVINYEEEQRNNGNFTDTNGFADDLFPGIPGRYRRNGL